MLRRKRRNIPRATPTQHNILRRPIRPTCEPWTNMRSLLETTCVDLIRNMHSSAQRIRQLLIFPQSTLKFLIATRPHRRRQDILQGWAKIEAPSGKRRRREVEAPQVTRRERFGEGYPPPQPTRGFGGASWAPPAGSGAKPQPYSPTSIASNVFDSLWDFSTAL